MNHSRLLHLMNPLGRRRLIGFLGMAAFLIAVAIGVSTSAARAAQLSPRTAGQTNIDDNDAAVLLGHTLPQIRDSLAGATRVALSVSDAAAPGLPRLVNQIYARQGKRTIQLIVWRGKLGATDSAAVRTMIAGRPTYVLSHVVGDGSTDVAYTSEFDSLAYILHVRLVDGLSREDADRIAASVK